MYIRTHLTRQLCTGNPIYLNVQYPFVDQTASQGSGFPGHKSTSDPDHHYEHQYSNPVHGHSYQNLHSALPLHTHDHPHHEHHESDPDHHNYHGHHDEVYSTDDLEYDVVLGDGQGHKHHEGQKHKQGRDTNYDSYLPENNSNEYRTNPIGNNNDHREAYTSYDGHDHGYVNDRHHDTPGHDTAYHDGFTYGSSNGHDTKPHGFTAQAQHHISHAEGHSNNNPHHQQHPSHSNGEHFLENYKYPNHPEAEYFTAHQTKGHAAPHESQYSGSHGIYDKDNSEYGPKKPNFAYESNHANYSPPREGQYSGSNGMYDEDRNEFGLEKANSAYESNHANYGPPHESQYSDSHGIYDEDNGGYGYEKQNSAHESNHANYGPPHESQYSGSYGIFDEDNNEPGPERPNFAYESNHANYGRHGEPATQGMNTCFTILMDIALSSGNGK